MMSEKIKILDLLRDSTLLEGIVGVIQKTGIIGEEIPIKAEVLICCGKLVKNKATTSTNAHPEDESGAGKDYITEHVMKIVFHNDWIKYTNPSPKAISYGQRKEIDKNGNSKTADKQITENSIVYIKDASEKALNDDDIKILLEEEEVDTPKVVNQITIHLEWKKPIVIITTADTSTEHQLIRRLPTIPLNTSGTQTELINKYQLKKDCEIGLVNNPGNNETIDIIKSCFYELKPVFVNLSKVKEFIEKNKPKSNEVIMRSLFPRLLDFIKFSCALYQFQREKFGPMHYYADKQDVKIGYEIFNYIYKQDFIDVSLLNSRQRKIRENFIRHAGERFTVSEINSWKMCTVKSQTTYEDLKCIMRVDSCLKILDVEYPKKYYYELGGDDVDWDI